MKPLATVSALLLAGCFASAQSISFRGSEITLPAESFASSQAPSPWDDIGGVGLKNLTVVGGVQKGRVLSANAERSAISLSDGDDGSGRERWMFTPLGDGTWQIMVVNREKTSVKYLAASGNGSSVGISDGDGSIHQRWRLEANVGFFRIIAWNGPGTAWGPYLSATEGGGITLLDHDDGTGRQRWSILPEGSVGVIQETANRGGGNEPSEPIDTKSYKCGIFNVTEATVSCPAWHQHAECWPDTSIGSCTPKCECRDGAAQKPPAPREFPPPGHWDVVTFTSSNSALGDGLITLSVPSAGSTQTQDLGASPSKIVQDVAFLCLQLRVSCPVGGSDTIAIPLAATLKLDATITNREVSK